jgi:circadian clock protein KaiC
MTEHDRDRSPSPNGDELPKSPSGIPGFDEITGGGLPRGRPTLICGGPGSGKTLFGVSFLVQGATRFGEPGVFMSFEENADELAQNVASLGFDLPKLIDAGKIAIDEVRIERSEIEETGEYDLEGLFVRLGYAIDSVGAKRVVLDTIESLFGGFSDVTVLRSELRRLFRWLKDKGVTAVVTAERGDGSLTRQGLEEYVSDAVILLDHRVDGQISTRRLRVVKYRGSAHGTNEYPFLIDAQGVTVMPVTSLGLQHAASTERISTGVARLDTMLGGHGYFRGSTILLSGTAGTGKTSLAAHFADAVCRRGERCLIFLSEESPQQVLRNMRSIGLDLDQWVEKRRLEFHANRPSHFGLETHLAAMHRAAIRFRPSVVVIDPVTSLLGVAAQADVHSMLIRIVDQLKSLGITLLLTSLSHGRGELERSDTAISSIVDTWLALSIVDSGGERNRALQVLKSRGMSHSNQIREFLLTDHGLQLLDVYIGPGGVLTGAARLSQEAEDRAYELRQRQEIERTERELARRRLAFEAQLASMRAEFEAREAELTAAIDEQRASVDRLEQQRAVMGRQRKADAAEAAGKESTVEGHHVRD